MKWLLVTSTLCVIFISGGCTRDPQKAVVDSQQLEPEPTALEPAVLDPVVGFAKELKEGLHFAASVEREAMRLLTKDKNFEGPTLFSVLDHAVTQLGGGKSKSPKGIDCGRFRLARVNPSSKQTQDQWDLFKICQKPEVKIATIVQQPNAKSLNIKFYIKEWVSVVGLSVTLTNPDVECTIQLNGKKLQSFDCQNWSYGLSIEGNSASEVRLQKLTFHRDRALQLKMTGGIFRDLIERKKIEINVPIDGAIKIWEKEIKVRDEFAETVDDQKKPRVDLDLQSNKQSNKQSEGINGEKSENESKKSESEENKSEESGKESAQISNKEKDSEKSLEKSSQEDQQQSLPQKSWEEGVPRDNQESQSDGSGTPSSQPVHRGR